MKSRLLLLACFCLVRFSSIALGESPKYAHVEAVWGSSYLNPDSVLIDTCVLSPSYGRLFGRGRIRLKFVYGSILKVDSVASDSTLLVDWHAIDTSHSLVRTFFGNLATTMGTFKLRKVYPDRADTSDELGRVFALTFDSVQDLTTIDSLLHFIPNTSVVNKSFPIKLSWIPSLTGTTLGTAYSSVKPNGSDDWNAPNQHLLGWEWWLYKMHCPLAWEMTKGVGTVWIGDDDEFGSEMSNPNLIRSTGGFRKLDNSTETRNGYFFRGDGAETSALGTGHGCGTMLKANAGVQAPGTVTGVAPSCNSVGVELRGSVALEDIDVDGLAYNGALGTRSMRYVDVAYQVAGSYSSISDLLDKGSIVFLCGGNSLGDVFASAAVKPGPWLPYASFIIPHSDPALDVGPIYVGGTQDGREYTVGGSTDSREHGTACGLSTTHWGSKNIWRGDESFITTCMVDAERTYNFSCGLQKYNADSDMETRRAHKMCAWADIVAAGDGFIDGEGTSYSAPIAAGVGALMKSVDKWLGVELDATELKPATGQDVQRQATAIITFTADKIADGGLLQSHPDAFTGFPELGSPNVGSCYTQYGHVGTRLWPLDPLDAGKSWQYDYNTNSAFTNADPLHLRRAWAQRMGFGRINAYRAVANTIPTKTPFSYSTSQSVDVSTATTNGSENGNLKLVHMGAWHDATHRVLPWVDNGSKVQGVGGWTFPNQLNWPYYNQGKTVLISSSDVVLTVPSSTVLAIDGLVIGQGGGNHQITTSTNSNNKILITGYLEDVEINGNWKCDDLIIYSDPYFTGRKSQLTVASGQSDEIYGKVLLQGHGTIKTDGGTLTLQPGAEIQLQNSWDITSGSHVIMQASSKISGGVTVTVKTGAMLEVSGLLPAEINCPLVVENGGTLIVHPGAYLKLDRFVVAAGGQLIVDGGRLTLNQAVYNDCYGTFWTQALDGHRAILTGGVSLCGITNQMAGIRVWGKGSTVGQISMQMTDDSDVIIKVIDARKLPFGNDHFSANRTFDLPEGTAALHSNAALLGVYNTRGFPNENPISRTTIAGCRFFDECGDVAPVNNLRTFSFTGAYVQNQQLLSVIDDNEGNHNYFYNLSFGVNATNCTKAFYNNNQIGVHPSMDSFAHIGIGLLSTKCGTSFQSNLVRNFQFGLTATNDLYGHVCSNIFRSDYQNRKTLGWCLSSQSSGRYDLLQNTFKDYTCYGLYSHGFGNVINLTDIFLKSGDPWAIYGRNTFEAHQGSFTFSTTDMMCRDWTLGAVDANHGQFRIKCGQNYIHSLSTFQMDGPATYSVNVDDNAWWHAPSTTLFCSTLAPRNMTMVGNALRWCVSSTSSCGATEYPSCDPGALIIDDAPSNSGWFAIDSSSPVLRSNFRNAIGMLTSDTNSEQTRRFKALDASLSAQLIDSAEIYVDSTIDAYNVVLSDSTAGANLKSSALIFKAGAWESKGHLDSARFAYNTVLGSYPSTSDSLYAAWSVERLRVAKDTLFGHQYDSAQAIYLSHVYTGLIAMCDTSVIDTGGSFKRSDGPIRAAATDPLEIRIHPNPVGKEALICVDELPAGEVFYAEIVDAKGGHVATIYDAVPEADLGLCYRLDCSQLAPGTYLVRVANGWMGKTVKFVRE